MIDIADLLTAWTDATLLSSAIPEKGTIHHTYLLTTTNGRYALRAYRYSERQPIEREHSLIAYACSQGIPAIAPLALSTGGTILERAGHYYALFPFAPGRHVRRGAIRDSEIVGMGRCLAQLHLLLQAYPHECVAQRSLMVDRTEVLARLNRTWMYEAVYLRHDDRLRPYINEGCFEPMSKQWQRLQASFHTH